MARRAWRGRPFEASNPGSPGALLVHEGGPHRRPRHTKARPNVRNPRGGAGGSPPARAEAHLRDAYVGRRGGLAGHPRDARPRFALDDAEVHPRVDRAPHESLRSRAPARAREPEALKNLGSGGRVAQDRIRPRWWCRRGGYGRCGRGSGSTRRGWEPRPSVRRDLLRRPWGHRSGGTRRRARSRRSIALPRAWACAMDRRAPRRCPSQAGPAAVAHRRAGAARRPRSARLVCRGGARRARHVRAGGRHDDRCGLGRGIDGDRGARGRRGARARPAAPAGARVRCAGLSAPRRSCRDGGIRVGRRDWGRRARGSVRRHGGGWPGVARGLWRPQAERARPPPVDEPRRGRARGVSRGRRVCRPRGAVGGGRGRVLIGASLFVTVHEAQALNSEESVARAVARGAPLGKFALSALRRATDRDKDGASPWFGGGDCDDRDPRRSPLAIDVPDNGIDEDCSGADLHIAKPRSAAGSASSGRRRRVDDAQRVSRRPPPSAERSQRARHHRRYAAHGRRLHGLPEGHHAEPGQPREEGRHLRPHVLARVLYGKEPRPALHRKVPERDEARRRALQHVPLGQHVPRRAPEGRWHPYDGGGIALVLRALVGTLAGVRDVGPSRDAGGRAGGQRHVGDEQGALRRGDPPLEEAGEHVEALLHVAPLFRPSRAVHAARRGARFRRRESRAARRRTTPRCGSPTSTSGECSTTSRRSRGARGRR